MSNPAAWNVEGPWDHGHFSITCTRHPRPDLKKSFWSLYEESFGALRTRSAARQVLTEDEFTGELDNARVWKYVAHDKRHGLAGLATLTDDVTAMPWISPEYFEYHYPDEWRRGAVYYVGITLIRPDLRHNRIYAAIMEHMGQRVAQARGVSGFDICGYNDRERSLGSVTGRILQRVAGLEVRPVDVQTYYVAQATGQKSKDDS